MNKVPKSSPFLHKVVVGTIATLVGAYAFWSVGRDFEFVKFEPHLAEEIERRKREHIPTQMKQSEVRTLDYTPEAKARIRKKMKELEAKELEAKDGEQ